MKRCELCKEKATMHCDSDKASLCFDCDTKVHSANFLVARHSRILLCSACQSPTPWSASGAILCPTVTVCEQCVAGSRGDEEERESEEENQIVPWSPPPASERSSCGVEAAIGDGDVISRKRRLESDSDYSPSDVEEECSFTQLDLHTSSSISNDGIISKKQRIASYQMDQNGVSKSSIFESMRFNRKKIGSDLEIAECLKSPIRTIDLNTCDCSEPLDLEN